MPTRVVSRLAVVLVLVATASAACTTRDRPAPAATLGRGSDRPSPELIEPATLGSRAAHSATSLGDGRLFVAGGCVIDGCGSATADTFLIAADGATARAGRSMSTARDSHTATLLPDGRVLLAGGFAGEGLPPERSIDLFDPQSGELGSAAELRLGRGGHAAALTGDGRVLIAGGWVGPRTFTATTELYDPATSTVTAGPDLPVAVDALDAVTLADGRVLVTGGQIRPGVAAATAAIFDHRTDTWTETGPMLTPRFKHLSVLLEDGSVLVMGGTTDDRTLLAGTEIFDPKTGRFTPGPDLHEPRYKMQGGAVVVDGRSVLVAGGGRTVEVLDLETGVSEVVADLGRRGSFATVSRLGSGDLVVLGGYDDRIALRGEVLVIDPDDL